MKFLLDECCSPRLVENLRDAGHDVLYVIEYGKGSTDTEVLNRAYRENRIFNYRG